MISKFNIRHFNFFATQVIDVFTFNRTSVLSPHLANLISRSVKVVDTSKFGPNIKFEILHEKTVASILHQKSSLKLPKGILHAVFSYIILSKKTKKNVEHVSVLLCILYLQVLKLLACHKFIFPA